MTSKQKSIAQAISSFTEENSEKLLRSMIEEYRPHGGYVAKLSEKTKIPHLRIWRTIQKIRKMSMEDYFLLSSALPNVRRSMKRKEQRKKR